MRAKFPLALAATLFLGNPAGADTLACSHTIDAKDYADQGGTVSVERNLDRHQTPSWFFCENFSCSGEIDLSFVIDEAGVPHDVKVNRNTFRNRVLERENVVREMAAHMRFSPPRLGGTPVCVGMELDLTFDNSGMSAPRSR